jgi:tetratricopeptide (TPR) repeat protein
MEHAVFRNPQSIHFMTKACQVHEHGSLLGCTMVPANEGYKELRALQNSAWALDSLKRGIAFAKKGGADNWENAIKCYQHAIEVDSKYVDAYTARGAALVLLERFDVAIESFQLALQLRPDDANALRYLAIAREKKQQLDGTPAPLPVISPRSALPATASQVVQLSETLNKEKLAALLLKEEKRERKKNRKEKDKDKDSKHKKKRKHKKDKKKSKKRKHNSSESSSSSDSESDSGSDDSSSDDDSQ